MLRPGRDPQLGRFERFALALGRLINETHAGRRAQNAFLRGVGYTWMRAVLSRWTLVEGLASFRDLDPDRGVLLVTNHRGLFDLYAVSVAFFAAPAPWISGVSFPVKADFFYERWLGVLVNLVAGAGVMYPPFFRQRDRARLNRVALTALVGKLHTKGWVVGFHPEGTRNKTPDPYTLLPMQPGVGELALKANPIVVPVFINGLRNGLLGNIAYAFKTEREPAICIFGAPIEPARYAADKLGPRAYKGVADLFGKEILALAGRERELRNLCAEGKIATDDPRWLRNLAGSKLYARRRPVR